MMDYKEAREAEYREQLIQEWDEIKKDDSKNYGLRYEYGSYIVNILPDTIRYGIDAMYMDEWYNKAGCTYVGHYSSHLWSKGKKILPEKFVNN